MWHDKHMQEQLSSYKIHQILGSIETVVEDQSLVQKVKAVFGESHTLQAKTCPKLFGCELNLGG